MAGSPGMGSPSSDVRRKGGGGAGRSASVTEDLEEGPIRMGDSISIFVEDLHGFVSADGFTDDGLYVKCLREDEIALPEFEGCVFQIQAKQAYHAQDNLTAFLATKAQLSEREAAAGNLPEGLAKEFKRLRAMTEKERCQNREEMAIYRGREVRFSVPFQLLHVKSHKFLRLHLRNAADAEGTQVPVSLAASGAASCFRFLPRHDQKQPDKPVENLENVLLVPNELPDTHALNCEVDIAKILYTYPPKLAHRVAAVGSGMTCCLKRYARGVSISRTLEGEVEAFVEEAEVVSGAPLRCGSVVRLLHAESDSFIAAAPKVDPIAAESGNALIVLQPQDEEEGEGEGDAPAPPSIYSMWLVEHVDPAQGAALMFNAKTRLRNVATGGYLCPSLRWNTLVARQLQWGTSGRGAATLQHSIASFRTLSQHQTESQAVTGMAGVWLVFPHPETPIYMPEGHTGSSHDTPPAWLRVAQPELSGGAGPPPRLSTSEAQDERDRLTAMPVDPRDLTAPFQIVSVCKAVRDFVAAIKADLCFDVAKTNRVAAILRDVISAFPAADVRGSKVGAVARVQLQTIARELQLLDLLVHLTDFKMWGSTLRKHSFRDLRNSPELDHVRVLCQVVFTLLRESLVGNQGSGLSMVPHLETLLLYFSEDGVVAGVGDEAPVQPGYIHALEQCVLAIYHDNSAALGRMDEYQMGLFVSLLRRQKRPTPIYMRFLRSLVEHDGQGVVNNQKMLSDILLEDNEDNVQVAPVSLLRGDTVLVSMPSFGPTHPQWVPIDEMLLARDTAPGMYYIEYINLIGVLTIGRTKTNDMIAQRLLAASVISLELCLFFMTNELLPLRSRAAYADLLVSAFIDCAPQEDKCTVDNLLVWSEIYNKVVPHSEPLAAHAGTQADLVRIKDFALKYLEEHDVQGRHEDQDTFTLAVCRLVHHLVLFGFLSHPIAAVVSLSEIREFPRYKGRLEALADNLVPNLNDKASAVEAVMERTLEVEILVQPIVLMLDPSTDNSINDDGVFRVSPIVVATKMLLCTILQLLCRIRLRLRINRLLQVYHDDLQNGLIFQLPSGGEGGGRARSVSKKKDQESANTKRPDFENILQVMAFDSGALTRMLGDLLRYQDARLDHVSLSLMIRIFSERHELLEALHKSVLLVNPVAVHLYFEHRDIFNTVAPLVTKLLLCEHEAARRREAEQIEEMMVQQERMIEEEQALVAQATPSAVVFNRVDNMVGALGKNILDRFQGLGNLFGTTNESELLHESEQGTEAASSLGGGISRIGSDKTLLTSRSSVQTPRTAAMARLTPRSRRRTTAATGHLSRRSSRRSIGTPAQSVTAGASLGQEKLAEDISGEADGVAEALAMLIRRLSADCAQSSSTLPLSQIQSGLRDLQVGSKVLEILRSLYQDGNIPEAGPRLQLAQECCTLLAWFTMGNVRNAAVVAQDLELLLSYLEHPRGLEIGVDQVICAMFYNNRLLCTQGAAKLEKRVISLLLTRGTKYPLLKVLGALLCPNGVGIKRNQVRVVRMFELHRNKVLKLFAESEGLLELRRLMRALEHTAGPGDEANFGSVIDRRKGRAASPPGGGSPVNSPSGVKRMGAGVAGGSKDGGLVRAVLNPYEKSDSLVLFHLYTIKVMALACEGNNYTAEAMTSVMFPVTRCSELLTAAWCIPETKIATLDLLLECHLLREDLTVDKSRELAQQPSMWKLLEYFARILFTIVDPQETSSFCVPRETPEMSREIVARFLPVVKQFCHFFRPKAADASQTATANKLCDALVKFWGEGARSAREQAAVAKVLYVMDENGITGNEGTRRLTKTLFQADRMNLTDAEGEETRSLDPNVKVSTLYPSFVQNFQDRIHVGTELSELIAICRSQPRSVGVITSQLTSPDVSAELKIKFISILQMLWETLTDEMSVEKSMEKIPLDVIISAMMRLVSSGCQVRECLCFFNSLLTRGEALARDKFRQALLISQQGEPFLREMLLRLEIAEEEIRESKAVINQVVMHAASEKGGKRMTLQQRVAQFNLNGATTDGGEQGGGEEGETDKSYVTHVLAFLQNLCEGHYLEMQNLLRAQASSRGNSVDLVTAVAHFIIEMETSISPLNVHVAMQAFDTLTEFLQGPCTGNIRAVLRTQLCEAVNSIIRSTHATLENIHYPREYYEQVRELKRCVVTTLLALLEGSTASTPEVPSALIATLDLHCILDYSISLYNAWVASREKQKGAGLNMEDRVLQHLTNDTIQTGFKFYHILLMLSDFESGVAKGSSCFRRLNDVEIPAINYYKTNTGTVELARDYKHPKPPEILKVYFRIPRICRRITRQMKDDILWGVDRTNDITRLRDFFSRVDDLYSDMKYQEHLSRNNVTLVIQRAGKLANKLYIYNVFLINILLLSFFTYRQPLQSDPDATWQELKHVELEGIAQLFLQAILPTIQIILEGTMLTNYMVSYVPDFVRKQFKSEYLDSAEPDETGTIKAFEYEDVPRNLWFYLNYVRYAFSDNNITSGQCFVWRLTTFVLSVVINSSTSDANQIPLLFYSFLLWELFPRSKQIGFVLKAVVMSGNQLFALGGMLLIFAYWFGVVGFLFFPDKFQFRRAETVDGFTVQNSEEAGWGNDRAVPLQFVWQGVAMVIDQGVRKKDVGEALDKFNWPIPCPNPAEYGCEPCPGSPTPACIFDRMETCTDARFQRKANAGYLELGNCGNVFTDWPTSKIFIRMIYTLTFFVMVSAIALEIIFGVIVDSFKALREDREETLRDISYKCFICGISRDVFDVGSKGFESHAKHEHNMWVYMYLLIHIREVEDKTTLNGVESYVWNKAVLSDVSFFPLGRAQCLESIQATGAASRPHAGYSQENRDHARRAESVEALEKKQGKLFGDFQTKLDKVLARYGVRLTKGPRGRLAAEATAPASGGRLQQDVDESTPSVVKEASDRMQIRRMYSPLEAFVVPALATASQGAPLSGLSTLEVVPEGGQE